MPLQDSFDNAGLQIGRTEAEVSGVLLCLDVTESVISEAVRVGANLVVSHHPLLFHGLKHICGLSTPERAAEMALQHGIAVYSAHTNLDNARGGVNYKIAEKMGAHVEAFLRPATGADAGSGVIARLAQPVEAGEFLAMIKRTFGIERLMANGYGRTKKVERVGICGGAGAFLLDDAVSAGCDAFFTGEMRYHEFFGYDESILIAVGGHYETEQYTTEILRSLIAADFPTLPLFTTEINTNPIKYL